MPAWDMGPPYFARFSAVSATGPLVTIDDVTMVPVAGSLAVTEVLVAPPVSAAGAVLVSVVVGGMGIVELDAGMVGSVLSIGIRLPDCIMLGSVFCIGMLLPDCMVLFGTGLSVACATAAPLMRADAATAVRMMLRFMGWVSCWVLKAPPQ